MTTPPDGDWPDLIYIPEDIWRRWNTKVPEPDPHLEALEVYLGVLEYFQQQIAQATTIHLRDVYAAGRGADIPVAAIAHAVNQIKEGREDE